MTLFRNILVLLMAVVSLFNCCSLTEPSSNICVTITVETKIELQRIQNNLDTGIPVWEPRTAVFLWQFPNSGYVAVDKNVILYLLTSICSSFEFREGNSHRSLCLSQSLSINFVYLLPGLVFYKKKHFIVSYVLYWSTTY